MPNFTTEWNSILPGGAPGTMAVASVGDLLYSALRLLQITANAGRGASDPQIADALQVLNVLIDAWNTDRLSVLTISRDLYPILGTQQQTYTIGPGGDWDAPRPVKILRASNISNANPIQPLELDIELVTVTQWQEIPVKNVLSTLAIYGYYQPSYPLGRFNLYPIPTLTSAQIALYTWSANQSFSGVDQLLALAPGYRRALEYNLAVELAPRFPQAKLNQLIVQTAVESKADLQRLNVPMVDLKLDRALSGKSGHWSYITDTYQK